MYSFLLQLSSFSTSMQRTADEIEEHGFLIRSPEGGHLTCFIPVPA